MSFSLSLHPVIRDLTSSTLPLLHGQKADGMPEFGMLDLCDANIPFALMYLTAISLKANKQKSQANAFGIYSIYCIFRKERGKEQLFLALLGLTGKYRRAL